MTCLRIPMTDGGTAIITLTTWPRLFKVRYKERVFNVEWHSYFGPAPLNRFGDPLRTIPKGFWEAIKHWERKTRAKYGKLPFEKDGQNERTRRLDVS